MLDCHGELVVQLIRQGLRAQALSIDNDRLPWRSGCPARWCRDAIAVSECKKPWWLCQTLAAGASRSTCWLNVVQPATRSMRSFPSPFPPRVALHSACASRTPVLSITKASTIAVLHVRAAHVARCYHCNLPSPLVDTQLYAVCTLHISNLDLTMQRLSQISVALSIGPGVARGMAVEPGLRPAASTPYDLEQSAMQDVLTNDATGSMLPTDTLVLVLAVVAQQVHGSVCVSLPSRARVHF